MTTLSPETGVSLAERTRLDFPILEQRTSEDSPLIYLDHAATSQKPQVVLDALKASGAFCLRFIIWGKWSLR